MYGKEKKKMSPLEQKAKMKALKEAHGMASGMMKDSLSGLKKVTVASDSKKGLKEGLDKAEDMLGMEDSEGPESEESEGIDDPQNPQGEEEESELLASCDSEEEINDLIQKLMDKKKKLQS